jgi:NADP-dependent 3-hydroxy acid dehydrogenase YdfG
MKKTVLVTGATSGFGKAIAKQFADKGHRLIITGRREDRLKSLKEELISKNVECTYLCFDVRNNEEVKDAINSLDKDWKNIDVLVNNAGLASGLDKFQDGKTDNWDVMIDTNVKGLLYVSKAVIPFMMERKSGHIINIGSTAGKEVYEKGNVYCASKHAVDAITKGMRIDLLEAGIKVTQIAPGAAETEFSVVRFDGDEERAKNAYNGYQPMSAEDVAFVTVMATELPANLCINDLVVTSLAQANSFYIDRKS